ncbi:rhomboid family intramembrane serine protease [Bdellovibrio bacteriovorus]
MILPCPDNFKEFSRLPLTWTLAVLNIFIFLLIFSGNKSALSSSSMLNRESLTLTGRLYFQYFESLPEKSRTEKPTWIQQINRRDPEQVGVLGAYALRDAQFVTNAEKIEFKGDQVQIAQWRMDLAEFKKKYQEQILFRFGISSTDKSPLAWVTYQFSHSNWIHLISNLIFLVVMGAAVETLAGGFGVLLIYLFGGFAGAIGFLWLEGQGTVPMVGASASVSALLAFYCVAETRMRVRFIYFLSPLPGHWGPIYLPTLLIIPLFLLVDLGSLLSNPEGLGGGVAYAAHLGGTVFGAVIGCLFRLRRPSVVVP